MAHLPEESKFDEGVYQLEMTDPVVGGPNGISNAPLRSLANRTRWLKDQLTAALPNKADRESPAFTGEPKTTEPTENDNSTRIASTSWVRRLVARLAAPAVHVGSRGVSHGEATTSEAGFMSAADKVKLNGIAARAQPNAVTSVAGREGQVVLSVSDVSGAAPAANPTFSGSVKIANNTQIDLNETGTTVFVPTKSLSDSGTGATEAASKQAVVDYAAPKVNASFSGTTNFSGTVVFDANGDARGRTWPATDNSVSFATTAWVRNAMADIASKAGFSYSGAALTATAQQPSGFVKLPSWLGGYIFCWVGGDLPPVAEEGADYDRAVAFPVAFSQGYFFAIVSPRPGGGIIYSVGPRDGRNNRTHTYVNGGVRSARNSRFTVFVIGK